MPPDRVANEGSLAEGEHAEIADMPWWLWMLLGMALAILELQIQSSFFLLGIGIGAVVVGVLVSIGLGGPAWIQWLLFSAASIGGVLVLRGFRLKGTPDHEVDTLVGTEATVLEDIPAGGVGRAELRGTTWTARTADDRTLTRGQRCRVQRVDGLTLWLSA